MLLYSLFVSARSAVGAFVGHRTVGVLAKLDTKVLRLTEHRVQTVDNPERCKPISDVATQIHLAQTMVQSQER